MQIQRIANASHNTMSNEFLFSNSPVIVTDAVGNWEAVDKFSIEFLAEVLYFLFISR